VMQRIRESLWLARLIRGGGEEERQGFRIGAKFTVPAAVLTDIVIRRTTSRQAAIPATHSLAWGDTSPFRRKEVTTRCRKLRKALIGSRARSAYRVQPCPNISLSARGDAPRP